MIRSLNCWSKHTPMPGRVDYPFGRYTFGVTIMPDRIVSPEFDEPRWADIWGRSHILRLEANDAIAKGEVVTAFVKIKLFQPITEEFTTRYGFEEHQVERIEIHRSA